jgi:hypothetical protein
MATNNRAATRADWSRIEDFAHLLAELASPFVRRRAVLAHYRLTEEELAELTTRWSHDLMQEGGREDGPLARRFNAAYAATTAALATAADEAIPLVDAHAAAEASPPTPAPRQPAAPAVEEPEPVGAPPLDSTLELSHAPPEMRLPFRAPGTPALADELLEEDPHDLDATLPLVGPKMKAPVRTSPAHATIEGLPHVPKPALPFGPTADDKKPKT